MIIKSGILINQTVDEQLTRKDKPFAKVAWSVEEVQEEAKRHGMVLTNQAAVEFLIEIENQLREEMRSAGRGFISHNLTQLMMFAMVEKILGSDESKAGGSRLKSKAAVNADQ